MSTARAEAIAGGVEALPHTPVYRMHRYFARRPYNVINRLIEHYSRPGDVVLDPFCGGGTTVVESLRLRRKVIGVDLNPMATLITRCEVMDLDPRSVKATLDKIIELADEEINALYQTSCPECGHNARIDWAKWSVVYNCPYCNHPTAVVHTEKLGPGKYSCTECRETFRVTGLSREADELIEQQVSCPMCGFHGMKQATEEDVRRNTAVDSQFDSLIEQDGLWYPRQIMPVDYELRKPNNLICERFSDFFSKRNLLALARLLRHINGVEDPEMRYFLQHVFTSLVGWTNRMLVDERHGWALHAYWLPDVYCENNVWSLLKRRANWAVRGKHYSEQEIGDYFVEAQSVDDILQGSATCWLLTQSSTSLTLPDCSVDVVITDPPYGGNIQYSELCSFWAVWLPETLGVGTVTGEPQEVTMKRFTEGEDEKYERLLSRVFSECYRVLKDSGWLVITFNNRDTGVWSGMLRSACEAGFQLAPHGISFQKPISDYARTLHQMKDGAIKGDFVLSFQKGSSTTKMQKQFEHDNIESLVVDSVTDLLRNGPATFSEIYEKTIPLLVAYHALDQGVAMLDLEAILFEHFVLEEVPIQVESEWPLKKTTSQKWKLPEIQCDGGQA
jgi:adenine-specific DNA methylase